MAFTSPHRVNSLYALKKGGKPNLSQLFLKLSPGEWYHTVIGFDPKGIGSPTTPAVKIYLNGKEQETEGEITQLPRDSNADIQIGHFYAPAYSRYFHGYIDDVRIYPYLLTQNDVSDIWRSPPDGNSETR